MADPPSGTVTFLFTDLVGSTRLWEEHADAMQTAMARHDELLRNAVDAHDGYVVKMTGDGLHAAFASASDAVAAAVAAQRALGAEAWDETAPLAARMGVHTGEAQHRDGDYYGTALNRAARLMSVGHGGQILVSHATEQLVRDMLPTGCELVELGEHRLRDLGRAELLFQVVHPDLPSDFARLRTVDSFPGNLPVRSSSFVGRERELERVGKALEGSRVVTLTGVGGVGKTRLALQVAAEVLPRFRDGAWLCELATVRDPDDVVDTVTGVFRVQAHPGLSLEESLIGYLRDQELLVVLDNCEHLLRPVAALVMAIEAACARVRVLATSREGLNIEGEQILVVPSLTVPEDGMDVAALGECEAVRLFVDRARAVKASFELDSSNADGVVQVCRRLDGVPLAIELAAARVSAMNPGELARRLDRRFRLLSGGGRVAIERQQTLRATVDWSYDLLSAPEQRLLDRLSVFAGGCTLEAAEVVCAGEPVEADDVFELLARLVAHHLVVADDAGEDTRYRLLETIRQYGEERLVETGETDTFRARHCDYYSELAGHAREYSYGPEQVEWGARLARERDNLFTAMAFALDTHDVERAMTLLERLPYESLQVNDVVVFDAEPVLALPGATDHPGSAVALMLAALRTSGRGDTSRGSELCEQALASGRRLGPTPGWPLDMAASNVRAFIASNSGALDEAFDQSLDAARHARGAGLMTMESFYLGLAAGFLAWQDPAKARPYAEEGLVKARATRAPNAIAFNLLTLAQTLGLDDPDRARALLDEALGVAAALGYEAPSELQVVLFTAARLGAWTAALRAASRSLHHQLRSGSIGAVGLAGTLNLVAAGLAEHRPEAAAVIQGSVGPLLGRLTPAGAAASGAAPPGGGLVEFTTQARREATKILVATLGDARLRELRAEGATMDETQTCTYARTHIDEYLAAVGSDNA